MLCKAILCLLAILVTSAAVYPQSASLILDHVDGIVNPAVHGSIGDSVFVGMKIRFWIRLTNNTGANITEIRNGFRVYSPDGATWEPISYVPCMCGYFDFLVLWNGDSNWPDWHLIFNDNIFENPYSITGSGADTISWGGQSKLPSVGVSDGFDTLVYLIETSVDVSQEGLTICLDTAWTPPAGAWMWTSDTGVAGSVIPDWNGPFCWTISHCCLGGRGNINFDADDKVNISDLTYLTSYMFGEPAGPIPACATEANINGDPGGAVNISDLTFLICYLFCVPPGPSPPGCP